MHAETRAQTQLVRKSNSSRSNPPASSAGGFSVRTLVRSRVPSIPYDEIKCRVLGKSYELSLVLNGNDLARRLNKERRNKTYAANILSFPLSSTEGEIFLNIRKAALEAKKHGVSHREWLMFLFIHGLLHLKGLEHGSTMERTEEKLLREFGGQ